MPKSFLVKNKKGRPTTSSSLSADEAGESTEEHCLVTEMVSSPDDQMIVESEEREESGSPSGLPSGSSSGSSSGSPSGWPSGSPSGSPSGLPLGLPSGLPSGLPLGPPSGSPSPPASTEEHVVINGGETVHSDGGLSDHIDAHKENASRSSPAPSDSPTVNGCNKCWWNSPRTRLELSGLPPPPKLIRTNPLTMNRNSFAKAHTSPDLPPVAPLTLFRPNNDGYCVVSYCHHEVPFVLRPPSDRHLDLSFRRRLSSDRLLELSPSHSDGPIISPNGRLSSDGRNDSSFRRHCPNGSLGLLPSPDTSPDQSYKCRLSPDGPREASLCPNMTPCTQPVAGSPFFIPSLPLRQFERLSPPPKQNQHGNVEVDSQKDETKYKCDICNSTFSLQRLLNRHMKTHSFYKRYHCQFCGKGFNDTFDLKRHIRTHTGIKPFKCDRCDKSFTQRCSLEAHLTRVHSVVHKYGFRERRAKMFVCEDCGTTFTDNSEFMRHLHETHPETEKLLRARRNSFSKDKIDQRTILH